MALGVYAIFKSYQIKKSTPGLSEIAHENRMVFPPGSKLIHSYMESWGDYWFAAVVEIDPQDVKPFINSLPSDLYHKPVISRNDRLGISNSMSGINEKLEWWNPDKAEKFIAVDTGDSFSSLKLLFNLDNPSRTVVYIYSIGD
ncbi:MAG: hypothetical protein ACYC27_23030 [Armatimonadota bacterium]